MTAVIDAQGLGKRYRRRWALTDCTFRMPAGHVVGLVGPNGAGKTTLLHLSTGVLVPTTGTVEVVGGRPAADPAQLSKVGFVAQDSPTYAGLSVTDHLELGAHLNPRWDKRLADDRIRKLGLDRAQKAGRLSGGERAQLALTLALAKRPELLVLDEPVASLDPLARRDFLQDLADAAAERHLSVVLSSHLLADLALVCNYLIVLDAGRVRAAGEIDDLLATHHRLTGPRDGPASPPLGHHVVISADRTETPTALPVRAESARNEPGRSATPVSLEDLVLSYLSQGVAGGDGRAAPEAAE